MSNFWIGYLVGIVTTIVVIALCVGQATARRKPMPVGSYDEFGLPREFGSAAARTDAGDRRAARRAPVGSLIAQAWLARAFRV